MLLSDWPAVQLSADDASRFLRGMRRRTGQADAERVRVYGPDGRALLGSGHIRHAQALQCVHQSLDRIAVLPQIRALFERGQPFRHRLVGHFLFFGTPLLRAAKAPSPAAGTA